MDRIWGQIFLSSNISAGLVQMCSGALWWNTFWWNIDERMISQWILGHPLLLDKAIWVHWLVAKYFHDGLKFQVIRIKSVIALASGKITGTPDFSWEKSKKIMVSCRNFPFNQSSESGIKSPLPTPVPFCTRQCSISLHAYCIDTTNIIIHIKIYITQLYIIDIILNNHMYNHYI